MLERLQKIISRAGIASRRHAEQLILSGAVTVNGRVVTELGTRADASRDHITVGPRAVRFPAQQEQKYYALHKPPRVVSTMNDPEGRPCLGPYLRRFPGRLFPVGRLDFDAAGLLVLTGDGELASDLMRAAAAIPQTWRLKVKGRIPEEAREKVARDAGVPLRLYRDAANAWYEATVRNAPRDLLRRSLARQGLLVEKQVRTAFAGVELGSLAPGEMRALSPEEVKSLRLAAGGKLQIPESQPKQWRTGAVRRGGEGREAPAPAVAHWRGARGARRPARPVRPARPAGRRRGRRSPHPAGCRTGHNRPEGQGSE
ncbi:MAG TPA: S4 domain-containing protein [Candidatus Acidoferrales bacterium]|nr:S4 domain-containing protein [Candidatus Acidoferrales bacterium]